VIGARAEGELRALSGAARVGARHASNRAVQRIAWSGPLARLVASIALVRTHLDVGNSCSRVAARGGNTTVARTSSPSAIRRSRANPAPSGDRQQAGGTLGVPPAQELQRRARRLDVVMTTGASRARITAKRSRGRSTVSVCTASSPDIRCAALELKLGGAVIFQVMIRTLSHGVGAGMSIAFKLSHALRRQALYGLAGLAVLASIVLPGVVDAPTAHAQFANCQTTGHVYLTQPGRVLSSLDQFNGGTQTVEYTQGTQSFRLGGNGIKPGTLIDFFAFDANTGAQVGFIPGRAAQYPTRTARVNCVVNEEGPFTFTLPPGDYRIQANAYFGMFAFNFSTVPVVNLRVLPAPPPPPARTPVEVPCFYFGCVYF
jgi:hypothetical protein